MNWPCVPGMDQRRYGLEHQGSLVPLEFGGALLLGLDGLRYQSRDLHDKLLHLLRSLQDEDAPGLGEAARDAGRLTSDPSRPSPDRRPGCANCK